MGIAGADRYDSHRRGIGDDACARKYGDAKQDRAAKTARDCCPDWAA